MKRKEGRRGKRSAGPAFNLPSQLVNTGPRKAVAHCKKGKKNKMQNITVTQQTRKPAGKYSSGWCL